MNYSQQSKKEICENTAADKSSLSLLSALVHTCGTVVKSESGIAVKLVSENRYLYPLADKLLKKHFGIAATPQGREAFICSRTLDVLQTLRILDTEDGKRIVGMISGIDGALVKSAADRQAYLKGAFLGAGSLSTANGYHLEIGVTSAALAADLTSLLQSFQLSCHSFERKDKHVVYMKRSEDICDFLSIVGATRVMLELTELLAQNKTRKDENRRNNLELSNLDRTINVGVVQAEAIRSIKRQAGLCVLDDKLLQVALLRLEDESLSYGDMANRLGVSKGSVKYRLGKIMEEAKKYGG